MGGIFLKILNMSISAGWVVLAVFVLRLLLKKAPKWVNVVLWGVVGIRLIMPFSPESILSLIPSAETISKAPEASRPHFDSGVTIVDKQVNEYLAGHYFEGVSRPAGNFVDVTTVLAVVWLLGMAALLIYAVVSYIRLGRKVRTAVSYRGNIYQSEAVISPFVLGIVKPRIYLPFGIPEKDAEHVVAHENAHIRRKDHWWKPLGYLLLVVHWFNPLMWLGYVLLCRDIELACDEKVVKALGVEQRADYSQALLTCSVNRRMIAACPLAFGEVGIKNRVRAVLNYKKPAFWIVMVAVIACLVVAVCFLTNPKTEKWQSDNYSIQCNVISAECDNVTYEFVYGTLAEDRPYICVNWTNDTGDELCFGEEFTIYKDGKKYEPKEEQYFGLVLHGVKPGKGLIESYELGSYTFEKGTYRLEKTFYFKNDPSQIYTAYIVFSVDAVYSFVGKQYAGERVVYEAGMYSFTISDDAIPEFMISAQSLALLRRDKTESAWKQIGELQSIKPEEENFDELFFPNDWDDGYSASYLRKNNLHAFSAMDVDGTLYYLLEQKNGDIYIAQSGGITSDFRWVFKMEECENAQLSGEPLNEPPVLVVISNEQSIEALTGSYSWCWQDTWMESMGRHPLASLEEMPLIELLPSYINHGDPLGALLQFNLRGVAPIFDVSPSDIHIRCWEEESRGVINAESEEIEVREINGNLFFDLKDGNYIYEVIADWTASETYGGTVRYSFYVLKANMEPQPIPSMK